jgi:diguanylate cyclase (GGDEF)-like protein
MPSPPVKLRAVGDAEPADEPVVTGLGADLLGLLVDRINVGIFTVTADGTVLQWNRFLHAHTRLAPEEVVGRNIYERFPELPREWLERKLRGVFIIKNFAFTSWKQRPYLFRLEEHRPLTGGVAAMRQDCAFIPLVVDGEVKAVSVVIIDVTDTYESTKRLDETLTMLAAQSERDALTGVYNRRKLTEMLDNETKRALRYHQRFSLLMLDIDHFKKINDTHGHLVGDEAIKHVAKRAVATLRTTDFVARYGGEEFVVFLPGEDATGAALAAERLREAVSQPFTALGDLELQLTISIGVTTFREDAADPKALLGEADHALYDSKKNGRNRVTVHQGAAVAAPKPPTDAQD